MPHQPPDPPSGRWLGVDHGRRRLGLAVSDFGGRIASPAGLIPATGAIAKDAERVAAEARKVEAGGIVVGFPLNMDGSEGVQAALVRRFADALREKSQLPVHLWDERLSSFQADLNTQQAKVPMTRRPGLRDALAAQVILQSFLDARQAG